MFNMTFNQPVIKILAKARLIGLLLATFAAVMFSGLLILVFIWGEPSIIDKIQPWLISFLFLAVAGFLLIIKRSFRLFLKPMAQLEHAVSRLNQGEPDVSLPMENTAVFGNMISDIDNISHELTDLYEDMDNRVARHTTRLAQKTASLKILYDVAGSINEAKDMDQLLIRFLRILKEMVNGLAGTVRIAQADGGFKLVGSIGLDDRVASSDGLFPVEHVKRAKVDVHHFDLEDKMEEAGLSADDFVAEERGDMRGTSSGNWAVHNYEDRSFAEIIPSDELFLGHFEFTPRNLRPEDVPSAEEVLGHFKERVTGLDTDGAKQEAERCMSCGLCFECDNCVIFCPQDAVFRVKKNEATTGRYVDTDYAKCIGCHICSDVCPTGYIKMGLGE